MKNLLLNKNERRLRRTMLLWGDLFALASASFIVPAVLQKEGRRFDIFAPLNAASGGLFNKKIQVSREANDREDFWLVLAMSNMAQVTLFSALVAANPGKNKHLCIPVLISKANSGALYFLFYLKTDKTPYLIGMFSDLAPFISILSAYARAL